MGAAVIGARALAAVILLAAMAIPRASDAGDHYALVVTGASGGDVYARKYDEWRTAFVSTLRDKFGYREDQIFVLAGRGGEGALPATREQVRRVLGDLRHRLAKDDQLLVLLIGHGSADGDEAKFNLVGPDLEVSEWADLIRPIPGRIVFVNGASGSFPFLQALSGPSRIVVTSTDSDAQQFETVFPEFFVKAFDDPAADLDKNSRVSMLEAFEYAGARVVQWFEQRGQLPTERPLLDDSGDGVGREARNPGSDGTLAGAVYVQTIAPPAAADAAQASLLKRQAELEVELAALRARRPAMPPVEYDLALERLLLELARVSQQIRTKS
jgi:hypothetical protein